MCQLKVDVGMLKTMRMSYLTFRSPVHIRRSPLKTTDARRLTFERAKAWNASYFNFQGVQHTHINHCFNRYVHRRRSTLVLTGISIPVYLQWLNFEQKFFFSRLRDKNLLITRGEIEERPSLSVHYVHDIFLASSL